MDDMADSKKTLLKGINNVVLAIKNFGNGQSKNGIEAHQQGGNFNHIFSVPFDGEKNLGEMGPIKDYFLQYQLLRLRSWQSYLESEISQTIINKFIRWIVGSGLKLQAEPNKTILEMEGVTANFAEFSKNTEARFALYSKSKKADYSGLVSLDKIAKTTLLNAKVGGDVLVILRLGKDNAINIQLVDGEHVQSNNFSSDLFPQKLKNGNFLINGIEMSKKGEHKAFWIRQANFKFERIAAKNRRGMTQAFLVYGMRYRLNNHRGIPLITVVLETLKKLERYKEATVGSAEERQKIAYFIEHGINSTGENPLGRQLAKAFDTHNDNSDLPKDDAGVQLANTVAASTNKQVFNMPNDATLKQLDSKNELGFKDFYSVNIDLVAAALGIPPEVALSKFDSNFSASRAALKDWEHTLMVERSDFKESFYLPIYKFWLETNILQNKISAPGYLTAEKDSDIREAYQSCRFIGANVPHIDPVKEVEAERMKLGEKGKAIPLTTVEKATENVGGGDAEQNMIKFEDELKDAKKKGFEVEEVPAPNPSQK